MNKTSQQSIAIIGAGTIGLGLAQLFASYQYPVVLIDQSETLLNQAQQRLAQNIQAQSFFHAATCATTNNSPATSLTDIMSHIEWSTDLTQISNKDYIFENITEQLADKLALYQKMQPLLKKTAIIAANTSCVPIHKLANLLTQHAHQLIGMHFMNPVPIKPVVEMIVSEFTDQKTIEHSTALLKQVNKRPVIIKDQPGFVINRLLMPMINQAIHVVAAQTASITEVDDLMVSCLGHTMGPLATADLIGLDTILYSLNNLYHELAQDTFKPAPLLVELVSQGHLGRKTGKGFYNYL